MFNIFKKKKEQEQELAIVVQDAPLDMFEESHD